MPCRTRMLQGCRLDAYVTLLPQPERMLTGQGFLKSMCCRQAGRLPYYVIQQLAGMLTGGRAWPHSVTLM